jgi:hypothetical protein
MSTTMMMIALGVGLVALFTCAAGVLLFAMRSARFARSAAEQESGRRAAEARAAAAEQENQALSRFRPVLDAEQEAARVWGAAQVELEQARRAAAVVLSSAQQQAHVATTGADQYAQQLAARAQREFQQVVTTAQNEAQATVTDAQQRAAAVTVEAQRVATAVVAKAQEDANAIAGDALRAQGNVENYRREAKALRNVIDGYGDRYLVPSHSVLDDLAEEFGFAEAGAKLKAARERTRALLKAGQAATCDYVEANRRDTAIAFVSDAFNGKVDSILSRVKEDNVGTLREKIQDAFTLVNMNGRVFRDARITVEYLESRLEELRWATAAQELKNREREEQRRIKEQIREEEKARREYERAMRDAEKEEEAIKKAMEKIQQNVARASEEQRRQFEAQLLELQQKLQVAEEKNKRALSMAQQTKTGHVYVISNVGSFGEDVFKIGLTRRLEPLDRVRELGDASVPFEFDVHAMILSEDAPALEHALHRHFLASQMNKVNPRKEFFRVTLGVIRAEIEKLGIQASWTMTAAAAEYRQSLVIDEAIRENPAQYEAWINKQLVLDAQIEATEERELAEAS